MEQRSTAWIKLAFGAAFALAIYHALRPITPREVALWDDLVRPPIRQSFFSPDAWNGWLYAVVAKRAAGILRLSEFSLRVPALIAGAVYLCLLPRRSRSLPLAIVPVALGWFSSAAGYGVALALCAAAWRWRRPAPLLLGFAIAASPVFAIPLAASALLSGFDAIERVAIPAAVTAFLLLIIPLSHASARAQPGIGGREVASIRDTLLPLRGCPVRLATRPDLLPAVRFYKDRYRQREWLLTGENPDVRIGL